MQQNRTIYIYKLIFSDLLIFSSYFNEKHTYQINVIFYIFFHNRTLGQEKFVKMDRLRKLSKKSIKEVAILHEKFRREIRDCDKDGDLILQKIKCLLDSQQAILLDISIECESLQLRQLSNAILKMHIQKLSIIKWIFSLNYKNPQKAVDFEPEAKNIQLQCEQGQKKKNLTQAEYFRMKQNSKFMVKGIEEELDNIKNQMVKQQNKNGKTVEQVLKQQKNVENIESSQKQQILIEAVENLMTQSQNFKKLTQFTDQHFNQTFKDLNVQKFSTLKKQIDQVFTSKAHKASRHLSSFLKEYLSSNINKIRHRQTMVERGDQTYLQAQKLQKIKKQLKKKDQQIQELKLKVKYYINLTENLEKLTKQKNNMLEEKLMKIRFQEKENQSPSKSKSMSKKSKTQKIKNKSIKQIQILIKNDEQDVFLDKSQTISIHLLQENPSFRNKTPKKTEKKKIIKDSNLHKRYQKSLKRIQKKQNYSNNVSDDQNYTLKSPKKFKMISFEEKGKSISKLIINNELQISYKPQTKIDSICMTDFKFQKLQLCSKTLEIGYKTINEDNVFENKNFQILGRRDSLLTVKNMGKLSIKSVSSNKKNRKTSTFRRESHFNSCQSDSNRKQLQLLKEQLYVKNNNFQGKVCRQRSQNSQRYSDISEEKQTQKQLQCQKNNKKQTQRPSTSGAIKNRINKLAIAWPKNDQIVKKNSIKSKSPKYIFQKMNIYNNSQNKNKSRISAISTQIQNRNKLMAKKIKSFLGENVVNQVKNIEVQDVLALYLNTQNAMEAQLSYGVSVKPVITSIYSPRKDKNSYLKPDFVEKSQKLDQFHKSIQKKIFYLRKNNPQMCKKVQNILRFPYTCIRNKLALESNQSKSNFNLRSILQFILLLHQQCENCNHIQNFLTKIGLKNNT